MEDGAKVHGETRITATQKPIKKLTLLPRTVRPLPKAVEAIQQADLILLGPGSLYTSILPNLLIPEIANSLGKSKAPRVYIANLMTQPGETSGYALADHLRAIERHVPRRVIDWVIANRQPVSPEVAKRYRAQGAEPVTIDIPKLQKLGYRVVLTILGAWLAYFSRNSCLASIMRAIKFALPDPCNAGSKRFFVFFASPSPPVE